MANQNQLMGGNSEMPSLAGTSFANNSYDAEARTSTFNIHSASSTSLPFGMPLNTGLGEAWGQDHLTLGGDYPRVSDEAARAAAERHAFDRYQALQQLQPETTDMAVPATTPTIQRRLVRVIISDPDPKMPLEHAILYKGEEQVTEMDDRELFFDIQLGDMLKTHNDKRVKVIDKDKTGKDNVVYLEPTRISQLKMTVVSIAIL